MELSKAQAEFLLQSILKYPVSGSIADLVNGFKPSDMVQDLIDQLQAVIKEKTMEEVEVTPVTETPEAPAEATEVVAQEAVETEAEQA